MVAVASLGLVLLLLRGILHVGAKSTSEVTSISDASADASSTSSSSDSSTHSSTDSSDSIIVITTETAAAVPTGNYISYTTTITIADSITSSTFATTTVWNTTVSTNGTTTAATTTDTGVVVTGTRVNNSTATATATTPANSQPCNGYTEFCSRQYSNITMVTAHNSPFVKKNNIASNQVYKVETQLEDGVRMRKDTYQPARPSTCANRVQFHSRHTTMRMISISVTVPVTSSTWARWNPTSPP